MRDQYTTVPGRVYKVVDESYEDDCGGFVSNKVTYVDDEGAWLKVSSQYLNMEADGIPRHQKICECCGHAKTIPLVWRDERANVDAKQKATYI